MRKTAQMQGPIFGQRSNLPVLCMRGCCGACSVTAQYIGLFLLPLGDAVTITLVGPAVTALMARALLNEPLGYRGAAGCLISILGAVVLSRPPFLFGGEQWSRSQAIGTAASTAAAFLGSGSSLTIRLIGNKEPAAVIAIWFHTCTMCLTAIPLALGWPSRFALVSRGDAGLLLGVAATSSVAQLLNTRGLQLVVAAKAAAMGFTKLQQQQQQQQPGTDMLEQDALQLPCGDEVRELSFLDKS
ncbi:hypothetical protein OEZ86_003920 [Tetradesmus obliquus]|nr:hypothetical protein OEZ86_003920 [Tetradesmus obliquus]